ncbi:aspartic peptidase domain-containing protein [Alternaria rosae]|uniref:aspartic peptidase domain-containing protein n=1 Tax=Alternaria rosae TaxID=1187941 RepID=UPI001E8DC180|nr:aspartic peptidase domain-containing protein [Alternaria rosae]KAH6876057.1 aspartic peptidase domain-containing protein [Alternaria rosae]
MFFKKRAEPIQLPTPYILSPSGKYEGNDGSWSTFFINVGDDGKNNSNGQNFRVLISTSSPATLVPQQTDWCSDPNPEECAANRGILPYEGRPSLGFDETKSSKWQTAGIYTIPVPEWYNDTLQAEEPAAVWGVDNVGLGESSPQSFILAEQYVVKYTVANFYMGSLGLAVGSTGPPGALKPNFMDNMYGSAHKIASRSFGYTAGAYYRNNNNGVTGSLVIGGYDKARLSEQGVSISMPSRQNNTLAVGVISILWKPDQDAEASTASFTKGGFPATIDSTLPYLILPDEVCDKFVTTFGLTLDEDVQLYTVDDSSHQQNLRLNPTLSFKISANADGDSTDFTDITLPYSALDQQAGYPLFFNTTRYLPIKRSQNGRFVLGRTLLQEAYIVVDYEHQNFTVAPATFSDPMPDPSLVTIFDRSYTGLPTPPESESRGGLSAGAIAGIVVGIVGAFIIVAIGAYLLWRKKRRAAKEPEENTEKPSEIDTTFAGTEIKYRRVSELTGSEAPHSPKDPAAGYYSVDHKSYPPISEMSPESTPAELYSPPPDGRNTPDYFANGRYAVPLAELPGGDTISSMPGKTSDMKPVQKPPHSRSPSDNSLSTNIDEVLAKKAPEAGPDTDSTRSVADPGAPATAEEITRAKADAKPEAANDAEESTVERRPSHTRGLSDTTIQSDSTAVSQPTPEELERWARSVDGQSRPMSPS